jgi:hypothetical protein
MTCPGRIQTIGRRGPVRVARLLRCVASGHTPVAPGWRDFHYARSSCVVRLTLMITLPGGRAERWARKASGRAASSKTAETAGRSGGAGGAAGVLFGGLLTSGPGWRWVLFVNVPLGIAIVAATPSLISGGRQTSRLGDLDLPGAFLVTGALLLLVYDLTRAPGSCSTPATPARPTT